MSTNVMLDEPPWSHILTGALAAIGMGIVAFVMRQINWVTPFKDLQKQVQRGVEDIRKELRSIGEAQGITREHLRNVDRRLDALERLVNHQRDDD